MAGTRPTFHQPRGSSAQRGFRPARLKPADARRLVAAAKAAQKRALAPFSHYSVGAAVLTASGRVYEGCNIESPTLISHSCAERSAIIHAVCRGEKIITAVCTVSPFSEPCGACRQMIREFSVTDAEILSVHLDPKTGKETILRTTIDRLLPRAHTGELVARARR